jgi:DNA polymerase-3 subunit delta'
MGFDDVLGNSRVKKILRLALQKNRIPNSLLFSGAKGVGKRSLARILAKAVNCEQEIGDACEKCPTCVAISGRRLPDVWEIEPEGQVIKIDQMRAVRQAAYLRPMVGHKRIFIIDEAEKMNDEASNSLLKILEEPPLFSLIILLTDNAHLILPTIRSRCQILQFSPVGKEEIRRVLEDRGCPDDRAKIISLLVNGNLEAALEVNWDEIQSRRKEAWGVFQSFLKRDRASSFLRSYAFTQRNLIREDFEKTLEIMASFCRDLILIKDRGEPSLLLNPDYADTLADLEKAWSLEKIQACLSQIDYAISGLNKNLNIGLMVGCFYTFLEEGSHV